MDALARRHDDRVMRDICTQISCAPACAQVTELDWKGRDLSLPSFSSLVLSQMMRSRAGPLGPGPSFTPALR